ncbi:kinesin motor domain-containing protein [Tribonema minus]|uniref:Kinesin-like protein n=1 Tax=Tribonema minus TaxID=303371 RepID=A0A835YL84_9STRA|nr:kinesin motor domain-containing protein [Tribonema minus]
MAARRPAGKRRATLAGGAELLSQGSDGSQDGGPSAGSGSGASHMIVAVRIRPLSKEELAAGKRSCCEVINGNTVVITKAAASGVYLQSQQAKVNEYAFDCAFGPDATQSQVYEATAKPYIEDLLSGINVTVFAYGATGAGKTHTMGSSGTTCGSGGSSSGSGGGGGGDEAAAASGIMPQSLVDVFRGVEARRRAGSGARAETWSVRVSYLEVYNEQILDLLEPGGCLQVCEDKARGVVKVAGLAERRVASCDEVLRLLRAGNANRKTEATGANAVSSRSHAVLQVSVTRAHHDDCGNDVVRESKLSLIDLAGSERASATNNTGALLRQGASINKSLLSLANCINTLAQNAARASGGGGGSGGAARAPANVKYRDSKLTRLLKTSLEGRCRVVMIANLNPSHHTYDDSHNTLHYANRAKDIKVRAALSALS